MEEKEVLVAVEVEVVEAAAPATAFVTILPILCY